MKQFNRSIYFFYLQVLVSFVVCQNETCDYKSNHCADLVQDAFKIYPNYGDKRTPDLIEMFGYPVEEHNITTDDGYILTVFRIPYSNLSGPSDDRIPVFCMHGFLASSAQWFWQPAERALVFMLVDAGYDVWIGNARGTSYSQGHLYLPSDDPDDLRYWDFSMYEMSQYDVPAVINYVTNYTSQPSLYWIGHSLGAGQFFSGMTLNPYLNSKVRTIFGMAPAAYIGNSTNLMFETLAPIYSRYPFYEIANEFGQGKYTPDFEGFALRPIVESCQLHFVSCGLCANVQFLMFGYSPCQLNFTTLPGYLAHQPDTVSAKTMSHQMQFAAAGTFRQYDYGLWLNYYYYGQANPPDYDWSLVDVPVVIYHSDTDELVVPKDVAKDVAALGSNIREVNKVQYSDFVHLDFITGIDADKFVYRKIIDIMNTRKYDRT